MNNNIEAYKVRGIRRLFLTNIFLYFFIALVFLSLFFFWRYSNNQKYSLETHRDISIESIALEKIIFSKSDIKLSYASEKIDETIILFKKLIEHEKSFDNKAGIAILYQCINRLNELKELLIRNTDKNGIIKCCPIIDKESAQLFEDFENTIEDYRLQVSDRVINQASIFDSVTYIMFGCFLILIIFSVITIHFSKSSFTSYVEKLNESNEEIIKTKNELEKAERYLSNVFANMIEGVAVYELIYDENENPVDYEIIDVNEAYEKLHGVSRDKILGSKVSTFYETHKSPFFETCVEVARTRKPIRFDAYYPPMQKYLRFAVFSPEANKFAIVFDDITESVILSRNLEDERKNLESAIEKRTSELKLALMKQKELSEHKDRFMSNMSHELRTPLNAILGFAQSLKLEIYGDVNDKQVENISLIINSGEHLLSLIDDILDMTKIDLGSMAIEASELNVNDLTESVLSIMKHQYNSKCVVLECFRKDDYVIQADERKVKQVLLNLLANALKFTPSGGKVILSAEMYEDEYIKFSVQDSGIGIKEDELHMIFEEFYQTENTKFQARGGAGIGLTLSKKMVELHNGKMYVESEENKGSTFWFILPIKQKVRSLSR